MQTYATDPLPDPLPLITSGKDGRVMHLSQTASGKSYSFTVRHGEVQVYKGLVPREASLDKEKEWLRDLTDFERVNVAKAILESYRARSEDPDGTKVASLLLTETGNLYVSVNGRFTSQRNKRQCAEQTGVSHADTMEGEKALERGIAKPDFAVREIFVMGGNLEKNLHIMGPCGDCTDMLSKSMVPSGNVWAIPLASPGQQLPIHEGANNINEVPAGAVWKTDIGFLNRNRRVKLTPKDKITLDAGMQSLVTDVRGYFRRPIVEDPNLAIHGVPSDAITSQDKDAGALTLPFENGIEASLDVRRVSMDVNLQKLNHYMREQILLTLANRIEAVAKRQSLGNPSALDDAQLENIIRDQIRWVRCAVTQRDDGKLFANATARMSGENTYDMAETNAFGQGQRRGGTLKLRKVFTMELNPLLAEEGVMRTSSKSAVGNLIKFESEHTRTVDFICIPYNNGKLRATDVADAMYHFGPADLLPTLHKGSRNQKSALAQPDEAATNGGGQAWSQKITGAKPAPHTGRQCC